MRNRHSAQAGAIGVLTSSQKLRSEPARLALPRLRSVQLTCSLVHKRCSHVHCEQGRRKNGATALTVNIRGGHMKAGYWRWRKEYLTTTVYACFWEVIIVSLCLAVYKCFKQTLAPECRSGRAERIARFSLRLALRRCHAISTDLSRLAIHSAGFDFALFIQLPASFDGLLFLVDDLAVWVMVDSHFSALGSLVPSTSSGRPNHLSLGNFRFRFRPSVLTSTPRLCFASQLSLLLLILRFRYSAYASFLSAYAHS